MRTHIEARIAEITREGEELKARLTTQLNLQLAPYNAAIGELRLLLDQLPPADAAEGVAA